jgi:15-cis-phytoene synthase
MPEPLHEGHGVSPADLAQCRAMIRAGSKTFFTASLLLPARIRDASRQLYAFCRVADDLVDQAGVADAVPQLMARLDRIYAGRPDNLPADRAFADVAGRFAIPRALPDALIEGFQWDAEGRVYETLSGVRAYAVRVAGTVGAMMAVIMGAREPEAVARATDLGIAMQLTNIARDVGEDARNGRLYMPRQWFAQAGLNAEDWLAAPAFTPEIGGFIARLLAEADAFYARAKDGIAMLPRACRPSIHAARILYAEIGRALEEKGLDSVAARAFVPKGRKLSLLPGAVAASFANPPRNLAPPCDEAAFLVEAVLCHAARPEPLRRGVDARVAWIVELFTKLESQRP